MFAHLRLVCTGFSGKVQTKMPARAMTILLSEVHIERYVQIRRVVCTVCTRNGEPPRGGNPGPGACEIRTGANIPAIPEDRWRIRKMGAIRSYSRCKLGCKRGAKGCKGVIRSTPAARSDPGRGSTPVGETAADRIRTISLTPRQAPSRSPPPPRRRPRRPRRHR